MTKRTAAVIALAVVLLLVYFTPPPAAYDINARGIRQSHPGAGRVHAVN